MDTEGRMPAPQGTENFIAPNRLGLSPMVHRRVETSSPSIDVAPKVLPSPLPTRRGMPR